MKINKLIIGIFATALFCSHSSVNAQIGISTTAYSTPTAAQSLVNNILLGAGVTNIILPI